MIKSDRVRDKSSSKRTVSYYAIKGCMDAGLWDLELNRRSITRHFYEGVGSKKTGWMSQTVQGLHSEAKRAARKYVATADHVLAAQGIGYFVCSNWDIYSNFEKFCEVWRQASQTCDVTSEENKKLRTWTGENSSIVFCPINERYARSGIRVYKENLGYNDTNIKDVPFSYPFEIPEGYLEWEEKFLLQERAA